MSNISSKSYTNLFNSSSDLKTSLSTTIKLLVEEEEDGLDCHYEAHGFLC